MTEKERREMMQSNYADQMEMMGYDASGKPLDDIVRVVRCKHCKWWDKDQTTDGYKGFCPHTGCCVKPDFYCADGARRDGDTQ